LNWNLEEKRKFKLTSSSIASNNRSLTRTYDILLAGRALGHILPYYNLITRLNTLGYIPLAELADLADSVCQICSLMFPLSY
jgi:hypothetical protein